MWVEQTYRALGYATKRFDAYGFQGHRPLDSVLVEVIDGFNRPLRDILDEYAIKVQILVTVTLSKKVGDQIERIEAPFLSHALPVASAHDLNHVMNEGAYKIMQSFDSFIQKGSGWIYQGTKEAYILVYKHNMSTGGTYCEVPEKLANTKAIRNVNNLEIYKGVVFFKKVGYNRS
jgi:hypothetical protein